MVDILLPFLILTLVVVIIIQAIERYFFARQSQQETARLITAVLSRNVTEYATAIKVEKEPALPQSDPDEIELSNASDETFDKYIENQTK